jgi:small subunit ribosomal protein S6
VVARSTSCGPEEVTAVRPYEAMIIFDADLDEETIRSTVDRSVQLVTTHGAEPGLVDHWGKRRLAYAIKRKLDGYYVVIQFRGEPVAKNELDRTLSLSDEVLRHMVIRLPEHAYGKLAAHRVAEA